MFALNHKEIHIFDIDGCIMPSIFPKDVEGWFDTEEVIKRMEKQEIYPQFKKFYKLLIENIRDIKIYFLTGRAKDEFLKITIEQLAVLDTRKNRDHLIMNNISTKDVITAEKYFKYKIDKSMKIIVEDNGKSSINIYDDRFSHYPSLKAKVEFLELRNVDFFEVKHPEIFWDCKYEEYESVIGLLKNKI